MKNIIFVCTGNTCRSPMASALYNKLSKKNVSFSRGIAVYGNTPPSLYALKAMDDMEIDISSHISKQIAEDDIKDGDLILTMGESHKRFLLNSNIRKNVEIHTLYQYAKGINKDIKDPFGGSLKQYIECRDEIISLIMDLITK